MRMLRTTLLFGVSALIALPYSAPAAQAPQPLPDAGKFSPSEPGPMKIGFEISLAPALQATQFRKRAGGQCASGPDTSVECTVFRYAIRNLGDRPIRNGRMSCSDNSVSPEYRAGEGDWKHLQSRRFRTCLKNIYSETPILPGEAAEGDFTLSGLAPGFDTSTLYPAGTYEFRFDFQPSACWASPDGSFCLQRPIEQPVAKSNVITISATAFTPSPGSTGGGRLIPKAR